MKLKFIYCVTFLVVLQTAYKDCNATRSCGRNKSGSSKRGLVTRGLFDSFISSTSEKNLDGQPSVAQSALATGDSIVNGLSSGFGWFSGPSPEELAKKKEEEMKAEMQRLKDEKKRKQMEDLSNSMLRIPGVKTADRITRKASSAIGFGLGLGIGRAQTLSNTMYDRLLRMREDRLERAKEVRQIGNLVSVSESNIPGGVEKTIQNLEQGIGKSFLGFLTGAPKATES